MFAQYNNAEENTAEEPVQTDVTTPPFGNSGTETSGREKNAGSGNFSKVPVDKTTENIAPAEDSAENTEIESDDSPANPASDVKIAELEAVVVDLEAKLASLAAQLAEAGDQLLRKTADFENFRKRMNQEKQNAIEFANQSLLLDIIPVIDDFERAIQSAEVSEELKGLPAGKAMLEGIAMVEKRLTSQLESKWGLKRFSSAGEPFDPNIHEAMFMEKSSDVEEPVVQEDFIKGYILKDRVIRAAKVKVLMPEKEGSGE